MGEAKTVNDINHFVDHLSIELQQLYDYFEQRWQKCRDSWKDSPFHELVQQLISDNPNHKGAFTELMEAIDKGNWEHIRQKALETIQVLFFIAHRANVVTGGKDGHH